MEEEERRKRSEVLEGLSFLSHTATASIAIALDACLLAFISADFCRRSDVERREV